MKNQILPAWAPVSPSPQSWWRLGWSGPRWEWPAPPAACSHTGCWTPSGRSWRSGEGGTGKVDRDIQRDWGWLDREKQSILSQRWSGFKLAASEIHTQGIDPAECTCSTWNRPRWLTETTALYQSRLGTMEQRYSPSLLTHSFQTALRNQIVSGERDKPQQFPPLPRLNF